MDQISLYKKQVARERAARIEAERLLEEKSSELYQANLAKSMFHAKMTHEIRTPLNGIIGFTDVMLREKLTKEQSEYMLTIKKSSDLLLNVVNDILDYSKCENEKIELEEVDFDLQACIIDILNIVSQEAARNNIALILEIADDVPSGLKGDIGRLQQILLNLLSNALKFTEEGAVTVKVSNNSAEFIEIKVIDTGVGFSPEVKDHLFSPFQQENASISRKYGGTGLGLTICKQLIEIMGGEISAQSELGKGAEFSLKFPKQLSETDYKSECVYENKDHLKGLKILIVNHNEISRKFFKTKLELWGAEVNTADSVEKALEEFENGRDNYQLIISGILLPNKDGLQFIKYIKSHYGDSTRPACALITAASLEKVENLNALSAGYDVVSLKPMHDQALFTLINKALDKSVKELKDTPARTSRSSYHSTFSRALIVDDNIINTKLCGVILKNMGIKTHTVYNGLEAIEALKVDDDFDFILMDSLMPEMGGVEATKSIRMGLAGNAVKEIPIIALSAINREEDILEMKNSGVNTYVSKPLNLKKIETAIHELSNRISSKQNIA